MTGLIQSSMSTSLRFLRPYLRPRFRPVSAAARAAHLRFYSALQPQPEKDASRTNQPKPGDVEQRLGELGAAPSQLYPRVEPNDGSVDCSAFAQRYDFLEPGEIQEGEEVIIRGLWEKCG